MDYDKSKVDELTLALMLLTSFTEYGVTRSWKGYDWDTMGRLHAAGLIHDPVGTGFSRATKPEYVKEFALLVGDVMAEAEFIRCWLLLHDADEAPVIVAGESYGSSRAGRVGYAVLKRGFNVVGRSE